MTLFEKNMDMSQEILPHLTPDLLNRQWAKKACPDDPPGSGHCYVGAEVAYHLLGGAKAGWKHYVLTHRVWPEGLAPGETHHFIRNAGTGEIVDPTSGQFENAEIPYAKGIGCGFLTGEKPSRRAVEVMRRMGR